MFAKCKAEYDSMLSRIDQVIRDKWPETLDGEGRVWRWLDEQRVEQRQKLNSLRDRLRQAWQNGLYEEMKELTLQWGKLTLEIFREYAVHLKREAAA